VVSRRWEWHRQLICAPRRPERNPTHGYLSTAKLIPFFAATDNPARYRLCDAVNHHLYTTKG